MIIEFAGLPKSGKSSNIGVARDYFSRSGYKTKLVAEGARTCPFSNKRRAEFACWTANHSLNAVLEAKHRSEKDTLTLQDRGLFDAVAFIKLLALEGHISDATATNITAYFVDPRWTQLVDLIILFNITPEKAIERDLAAQFNAPPGVITNVLTMRSLSAAYAQVMKQYGDRFPLIVQIETTNATAQETAREVIRTIEKLLAN